VNGLYGQDGDDKKLTIISDQSKARALLRLLDLTIGRSDGAVIPYDLTDALDQIRSKDSTLSDSTQAAAGDFRCCDRTLRSDPVSRRNDRKLDTA
jgi:hypothetical protein